MESIPIIRNEDYWVRYVNDAEFDGFGRTKKGGVSLYHIKATTEENYKALISNARDVMKFSNREFKDINKVKEYLMGL